MIVAVRKTVYPNGQEVEHNGSMKVELDQAPDTKQFNKFFDTLYKSINKQYKCSLRNKQ